ncbi:MAG: hypothetical protein CMJ81_01075 [Planctomycetaceae bacterium]|nr:hypothetical protein [Planctomycetaceae bacterium]
MKRVPRTCSIAFLSLLATLPVPLSADEDELPPGLEEAIKDPAIPMIVDATITKFTEEGYAEIKVNKVYKASQDPVDKTVVIPSSVKGYLMDAANRRVVPISIITDTGKTRFLFFLDGDFLFSTYNNRFEIRRDKKNQLVVDTGGGWKPLTDIVKLIPASKIKKH